MARPVLARAMVDVTDQPVGFAVLRSTAIVGRTAILRFRHE